MANDQPELSIVVPVYRSEECLKPLVLAIEQALAHEGRLFEIILVNDCSPDGSWNRIKELSQTHANVIGVDLRKNFGQDSAILTGIGLARGKYVAVMDDDLQHDPDDLPRLVKALKDGNEDVVYANFSSNKRQALWKNLGSAFNDRFARWVIGKPAGIYLSPYKVIRGDVAKAICLYEGRQAYVDGLLFQVTSRIAQIPAEHHERIHGTGNYTFWKSVRVWSHLAFSFSTAPLRLVTALGLTSACAGVLLAMLVVAYRLLHPQDFPIYAAGWASLLVAILVIGGVQMFFFGVLGEYVGRTYLTASRSPQTSIATIIGATASGIDAERPSRSITWSGKSTDS
jgi:polyisoprenyl-phosphate glycosyltransferase